MSEFQNLEEAQAYFENDRFAADNGVVIDALTEDGAVCSLTLTEKHQNAIGVVQGGVIFTLGDFALAVSCNNRHRPTTVQQAVIHYFNAPKGNRLIARAHCKKDGKTTCVYNVDITDETGRVVAQFTGTGYKL